jgi:hypothetical protein
MVLLLLGIVFVIILIIYLIIKYSETPKNEYAQFNMNCIYCGDKANGLKCIRCKNK